MIYLFMIFAWITATMAQSNTSLATKMDEIATELDGLSRVFADSRYKYTSKIRTRLVDLLLRLIPAELEMRRENNPELQQKFDDIQAKLEKKMRISYVRIKERISTILGHFIGPAFAPFALMNSASQTDIQQAFFSNEQPPPTPAPIPLGNPDTFIPIASDAVGEGSDRSAAVLRPNNRVMNNQPEFLPTAQPPLRSQFNFVPTNRFTQEYDPRTGRYYWPQYQQRVAFPIYQNMQPSSQWYWPQTVQSQPRQQYFWVYPYGTVYGPNSGF